MKTILVILAAALALGGCGLKPPVIYDGGPSAVAPPYQRATVSAPPRW